MRTPWLHPGDNPDSPSFANDSDLPTALLRAAQAEYQQAQLWSHPGHLRRRWCHTL